MEIISTHGTDVHADIIEQAVTAAVAAGVTPDGEAMDHPVGSFEIEAVAANATQKPSPAAPNPDGPKLG